VNYGIHVANIGTYSDSRRVVRLAATAEESGWDALFLWDHLAFVWGVPAADPWVTLAAVATSTERILVGTGVTPVARRRPHVLAHQIATLATLSSGRLVFGAGLGGVEQEFGVFGEPTDPGERAAMLDEGLEVIRRLLAGERVSHRGRHYTVEGVALQTPGEHDVPIWIGGNSPRALDRAARFDGWFADSCDQERMTMSPDDVCAAVDRIGREPPFDVAVEGYSEPGEHELHDAYARAGVTWWFEELHDRRADPVAILARVGAGP
jgi:alkanesulfonate monooxygenase SsuD/methylene tetrahydromethanopterin reductase-like flavin-dependent oxidoreductase (luciferase family)